MTIEFVYFKTESILNSIKLENEWCGSIEDLKYDIEDIAAECAEQYWNDHDGWDRKWPITFSIFKDAILLGYVEVEMEMEPMFSATTKH